MSSEDKALVPIEARQVDFYGDELTVVLVHLKGQRRIFIPLRPLCNFLGLDWAGQRQRLQRDMVLSQELQAIIVPNPERTEGVTPTVASREMLCLPLDLLNGWLFGINAARVKKGIRERLVRYQRECYRILADAFLDRPLPAAPSPAMTSLAQIKEMALAIAEMAEQQMEFEQRISSTEDRLDRALNRAAVVFNELGQRVTTLEKKLAPGNPITDEQAAEIQAAVHALAMLLTEQDSSKNHFQGVFTELHRRFGVTSYKLIPQEKFAGVIAFLEEWRERASKGNAS